MNQRGVSPTLTAVMRGIVALLLAAAVVAQAARTIGQAASGGRDVATTAANFFSFFTVLSNSLTVVVLVWAVVWGIRTRNATAPRPAPALHGALAAVTVYMLVTGVVYHLLLRGVVMPEGETVPWSNALLHTVGPLYLLIDLLWGYRPVRLGWGWVGGILIFPVLWVTYTLVRANLVTNPATGDPYWYPYPFLNPHLVGGYGGVAAYIAVIAVGLGLLAGLVVWISRVRNRV